jgi:hypothetical protein
MDTALAALLMLVAILALFDLAAVGFGEDSRDGLADDRRR